MTTKPTFEVEEGQTKITVPHLDGQLTFIHPYEGPGTYGSVANGLEQRGLALPTMSETASLAYAALQNQGDTYADMILNRIKNVLLWAFNGILYVPDDGAYIQDNPRIENGKVVMNLEELAQKLRDRDESVRHVPFNYKANCTFTSEELAVHPFVVGLAGKEGVETLAKAVRCVARPYSYNHDSYNPYLWALTSVEEQTTEVAALLFRSVGGLGVDGYCHSDAVCGCSFGVLREGGEATRAEK